MEVLRCKTLDGVLKELYVFALAYNLARVVLGGHDRAVGLIPAMVSIVAALFEPSGSTKTTVYFTDWSAPGWPPVLRYVPSNVTQ